ncbi:ribosome biogenesis protein TSR3, putative [Plasmodium vinckei brucechwatti]|uniref:18S rRNA aminocarboxypropyltransferase n=1 Tax=Plasmodium vinckei brucechwatti TaxID=119398 RepID=A0A6V7SZ09_PLAVN|nr:ribosome biogenesis protein TSR3, putative [Plasmodium vinckei brucechwatti]
MKNNQLERKKYSVHNLVKLINERQKQNAKTNKDTENVKSKLGINLNGEEKNRNTNKQKNNYTKNEKRDDIQCNAINGVKNKSSNIEKEDCENKIISNTFDEQKVDKNNENLNNNMESETNEHSSDDSKHQNGEQDDEQDDEQNGRVAECEETANKNVDEIKLFMIDYNECQNKKCSCKKLYRFKKIKKVQLNKKFKGIVLTPFCDKYFSIDDIQIVEKNGLAVVDCSWKSIDLLKKVKYTNQRKLPYIIAVNSINYGKPYKLSCLESLAFCLYICNYNKQYNDILSIYKWSLNFTNVNMEVLEKYKLCRNHEDIKKAEQEFIENSIKKREENKQVDHYKVIYEDEYI